MRIEVLIICFQFVVSIGCNERKINSSSISQNQNKRPELKTYEGQRQESDGIWREYRRITGRNMDTLPYSNCFVTIKGNKMTYNRVGKQLYSDSIYLDKKYVAKTYRFKNHTSDVMNITGDRDEELVIKRDAFEGDYEYFRKDHMKK